MTSNPLYLRTIATADDLSTDEMLYLFNHTRALKESMRENDADTVESYRLRDSGCGIYTIMLEDSTRTRESFANAARFHAVKYGGFDATQSSINKEESYADTVRTLLGYNNSIFIIRSKVEGLCRWLEDAGSAYAQRHGLSKPAFINAGDGKHEHPTQELLDEYTFWEDNGEDTSRIHVALIGDLLYGRTVHSKVEGLRVFGDVTVDLIAPSELAMPAHYVRRMRDNGFTVREYASIQEYLEGGSVADKWYFTRPQLERMGEEVRKREQQLREAITFSQGLYEQYGDQLPASARFYHPLPRNKHQPTVPPFLDGTRLNGYERQSRNGYFLRIVLLAAVGGALRHPFAGKAKRTREPDEGYITRIDAPPSGEKAEYAEGIRPISNGIVIDHICRGDSYEDIEQHCSMIIDVLNLYGRGGRWAGESYSSPGTYKGMIFKPDMAEPAEKELQKLAALAPGCTLNVIANNSVIRKYRFGMPDHISGFSRLACQNPDCISASAIAEGAHPEFHRYGDRFFCRFCNTAHTYKQIWQG